MSGSGSLSFYGPAETSLGVSGNWDNYSATISGNVSITLTTAGLTLNGIPLPAGTYTIATTSATLSGSGPSTSPNFSGSASITTAGGTVDLGPGTGTLTVGGSALNPINGVTLTAYTGSITVAAGGGNNTDAVTLNGTAANVLTVSGSPATLTTDQNTPVTFQTTVKTSFADKYTLTAQTPTGWTVTIDNNGHVTVTPAPGLQSGTFPIQIIAQSTTNPDLVAQAIVNVTIRSTLRTITLNVAPDPLTTVPFNGAELPTAFVASIHNNASTALTVNLAFSNIASGFTLLDSGTSVTIPAGQTGSVGVYLQPTSQIPAPGSQFSFTVTATASGVPTVMQTVMFTVPAVDGITLTGNPPTVNAVPGATATDVLTITNVGNVPENVTLSASATSGLTVTGLSNISLQPGQSTTENVGLTPDAATPLNSFLSATITATFGPSNSPQTVTLQVPVNVVVPGALAIAAATASASQLGETALAARLNDLNTELTSLVPNPTNAVFKSQVLASFDAVIALLAGDVYLTNLTGALTADRAALAQASTATDIGNALAALGNDLGSIATTLSDEIAHSLKLMLDPNQGQARPQAPVFYQISLQNTGTRTTTYDLSISGLPSGVTASFNQSSVTLQPGQVIFGGPNEIVLTLVETGGELVPTGFTVTATAEGAPEINRSATGSLTVRNEFVQIASVTPNPTFTNPGGKVDVSAHVLNVTANPIPAQALYTVSDPGGNTVFTSTPVAVPFSQFVSFPTVDLGSFDTTGLAVGSYTISVRVTDAAGNSLTAVPGQASLLIGTPVTASLSLSPTTAEPNFSLVQKFTNTLKVDTQASFAAPLTLAGFTATDASESSIALNGTLAYVVGNKDVSIVDVHDPANPMVVGTFGSNVLTPGNSNLIRVAGNQLLIASDTGINSNSFSLLIYSITNPLSPALISNTTINYRFPSDMIIQGTTAFFPLGGVAFFGAVVTDQFGDFLAVDFSNPSNPHLADVLFNNRGSPDGGDHIVGSAIAVNSQLTYVATTTSAGRNTQTGNGELLIVNTSNPANMTVAGTLAIPDTIQVLGVAIQGNRALVIGSTGGELGILSGGFSGLKLTGNLTLTPLDISDPLRPTIIGPTFVTQEQFFTQGENLFSGKLSVVALGNGLYAVSDTKLNGNPVLLLVDANDPNHMVAGATQTPSPVNELSVANGMLYAATQDGLSIYNIGQVLGLPVTVSVEVPTGTAVTYEPTSFNIAPSQIVHEAGFDTITWVSSFGAGVNDLTLTWTSDLSSHQAPGPYPVTLGATVDFISQGTPGSLTLPGTVVYVSHPNSFFFVTPASRTVQPGAPATYNVELLGTAGTPITFNLSVVGVPASWVSLPAIVTEPALKPLNVPLTITSDPAAPAGTYNFTVVASGGGQFNSVQATLILQGQPVLPSIDPHSHGVVATLTPAQASAGQGTSTTYTVQLTNTGSADDTFTLSATGLPAGIAATFGQTTIDVPPGTSNFRNVFLTLTPQAGTAPGSYNFTVTTTSTTKPSITATASGMLTVLGNGVSVALNPSSGAPGSTFQLTVTNTGRTTDTFDLTLGGPAALVSQLALPKVTLVPGAFRTVTISTGPVNFVVPGSLNLAALATSEANPAVRGEATANLTIPATTGMTAGFNPASQVLPLPGSASFLLLVNNTGNTEDAYMATITGTTGSLAASLTGLNGQPTQAIPLFRLPGLSTGAILVQTNLALPGQGTVTVQVKSLSDGSIMAAPTATLSVATLLPIASNASVNTPENTAKTITLTASDPNSPPQPLTYIITAGPAHGTLGAVSGNMVTYTPNANYFGPDSFQFKVNNGISDSNTATVSIQVIQATVSTLSVGWGSQTIALQPAGDGVRLLPAGRNKDLPWFNINRIVITLPQPAVLNPGDVSVTGRTGGNYGPVTISGSGTSTIVIRFAKAIAIPDRVMLTIGNAQITTFTGRIDVLPGDTNDDGVVNTTDGVLILNNPTPAHPYLAIDDLNGDGAVNMADFTLYRPKIGTTMTVLPPQLAAGGQGPGGASSLTQAQLAPVLAEAIDLWAAAGLPAQDVARLHRITAQITVLPHGDLGEAAIGGNTMYLSADAAGYGWFIDTSSVPSNLSSLRPAQKNQALQKLATMKVPPGREDLLTVVMHELGHTLGLDDLDPAKFSADLMAETLAAGVRRLPSAQDVAAVIATDAVFAAAAKKASSVQAGRT